MSKIFERVNGGMPSTIRVAKHNDIMIDWKAEVAGGMSHPLRLEEQLYIKITLGAISMDHVFTSSSYINQDSHDERVDEAIKDFLMRPEVSWANDVSFDGVYIHREPNFAGLTVRVLFSTYMEEKQATFWKLKFSGDIYNGS